MSKWRSFFPDVPARGDLFWVTDGVIADLYLCIESDRFGCCVYEKVLDPDDYGYANCLVQWQPLLYPDL